MLAEVTLEFPQAKTGIDCTPVRMQRLEMEDRSRLPKLIHIGHRKEVHTLNTNLLRREKSRHISVKHELQKLIGKLSRSKFTSVGAHITLEIGCPSFQTCCGFVVHVSHAAVRQCSPRALSVSADKVGQRLTHKGESQGAAIVVQ